GYAGQVDQRPYILLWNVASNPAHDLQGETGIETDTVQLDIYADSYAAANRLTELVADATYRRHRCRVDDPGSDDDGNRTPIMVHSIMRSGGPRQSGESAGPGSGEQIARVSIDIRITHSAINET
ncbi:MAG: hypothetical protein AAFN70_19030, partial [Planctomycetota bacterium]